MNDKVGDVEADAAAPLRELKLFEPEREKAEIVPIQRFQLSRLASRAGLLKIRFRQNRVKTGMELFQASSEHAFV